MEPDTVSKMKHCCDLDFESDLLLRENVCLNKLLGKKDNDRMIMMMRMGIMITKFFEDNFLYQG